MNHTMRNPQGFIEQYDEVFKMEVPDRLILENNADTDRIDIKCNKLMSYSGSLGCGKYICHQYGLGLPLEQIAAALRKELPVIRDAIGFVRANSVEHANAWVVYGSGRRIYGFAGLVFLLLPAEDVAVFAELITPLAGQRGYLFDLLSNAFIDGHQMGQQHSVDKYSLPWTNPMLAVLALPAAQRGAALVRHMDYWCSLMRPFGWKPEAKPNDIPFFNDFAFEVALAVCAYDIDDSAFHEHPYYPRDLVSYYRTHLRHTRDAWRPLGQGAGVAVIAPPAPVKADLARSRRKQLARWVELVCDGATDATDAVLEQIGRPRRISEIDELMCALSDFDHAIHVDLNDGDTLAIQTGMLTDARGLTGYEAPAGPWSGLVRCGATLRDLAAWSQARGYCLIDLDGDDDAWHAVLVRSAYQAELLALSAELGMQAEPVQATDTTPETLDWRALAEQSPLVG
jgi:hypothetical protein